MSALIAKILSYTTTDDKNALTTLDEKDMGGEEEERHVHDRVVDISSAIADDLSPQFVWHLGKGEFLHWVDVFNAFDSYLSNATSGFTTTTAKKDSKTHFSATRIAHEAAPNYISKTDVCSFLIACGEGARGGDGGSGENAEEGVDDDSRQRRERRKRDSMKRKKTLLWILRCTRAILDECWNKHVYNSLEQLTKLLHHEDFEVAYEALLTIHSVAKKTPGTRVNRFVPCDGLTMRLLILARMNDYDENENKQKNEKRTEVQNSFPDLKVDFLFGVDNEDGIQDGQSSVFDVLDESNVSRMYEIVESIEEGGEVDSSKPENAVEAVIDSRLRVQEEGFNKRTKLQEEVFKKLWTLRWSSFAARDAQTNTHYLKDARVNVANLALATLLQFGDSTEDVSYDCNYTPTKTPIPSQEMRRLVFQTSTMQEKASELVQQLDDRITNIKKNTHNSNSEPPLPSLGRGRGEDAGSDFSTDASVAAWAISALVNERDTSSAAVEVLRTHKSATILENLFTISVEKLVNAPDLSKKYFDTATDSPEERGRGGGNRGKDGDRRRHEFEPVDFDRWR